MGSEKRKLSDMLGSQWSKEELSQFYKAYRKYGKNWRKVAGAISSKSAGMVESLYNINKAFFSLPEGQGTADAFLAMMTDRHNILDISGNGQENNNAPKTAHKPKKHACGKPKPDDNDLQSHSNPSSHGRRTLKKFKHNRGELFSLDNLRSLADVALGLSTPTAELGGRDPPPPIIGKGKGPMSDTVPCPTRRQNMPSPSIVIRESADGYSRMPSTFTLSASAVAPRPSVPAPHPLVPTSCPPSRAPSSPPPVAPSSLHIDMFPNPGIMTHSHHSASTSTGVAGEQQYSPGYSHSPSDADVHEQPEEVELMPDGRPIIRPSGNGFLPSKRAASVISFVIQQRFHRALPSWGKLTRDERISMFDAFRGQAAWRIDHESEIERIFHYKASTRLSDMLRETRECGSQPPWIEDGIWEELHHYWASDEFKKKSNQAKKNRASEKGGSLHTGGCVSQSQWAERMAKQYNRGVQIHEVHKRTHTRKGTGEYIDKRSKHTQEEFHVRMSQARSQASASSPSNPADLREDEQLALNVWADVVGGKYKGRLYGAGDLAGNYRKGPSRMLELRVGASTSSSCRPQESAEIAQLRQMLAASQERERQRDEEHRQMMDTMRQRDEEHRQMMDTMRQMMETVQQLQQQQRRQPSQATQHPQEDDDSLDHFIENHYNDDS